MYVQLEDCVHCPDVDIFISIARIADKEVVEIFVPFGTEDCLQVRRKLTFGTSVARSERKNGKNEIQLRSHLQGVVMVDLSLRPAPEKCKEIYCLVKEKKYFFHSSIGFSY